MKTVPAGSDDATLEQAVAWFVRLDDGDLSPEELAQFKQWRAIPGHAGVLARVEKMWAEFGAIPVEEREAAVPGPQPRPRRRAAVLFAMAAGLLLGLSLLLDMPLRLQADMRTAAGEVRTLTFPDGSVATLGSASAVSVAFDQEQRIVHLLRGEALFKVAPDAARPFIVQAGDGAARALGTEFAVRRDGGAVTVTVLESHVRVTCCAAGDRSVTLSPGQQTRYSFETGVGEAQTVEVHDETAWTRGKLIFVGRALGDVVDELNRYFPGRILLADEALRHRPVSGVFATTDPAGAMDGLEQSLGLHTTRFGNLLILVHG